MDDEIKLPGSSYDTVAKIIQGYAYLDREASLDEVARQIGMDPTIVSRNHGFLVSIGVITGGQKKAITPKGKKLGTALSHDIELEIQGALREIVSETEFLKGVVAAVRIRKGMDDNALKAHVAYSAGASKSPSVMTGSATVVEILKQSGMIQEEDGKFVAAISAPADPSQVNATGPEPPPHSTFSILRQVGTAAGRVASWQARPGLQLSIEIQVQCTANELDSLGEKLRKLVDDFEKKGSSDPDGGESNDASN